MPIRSLSFSPDSQLLLTASDDGHMKIYDVLVDYYLVNLFNLNCLLMFNLLAFNLGKMQTSLVLYLDMLLGYWVLHLLQMDKSLHHAVLIVLLKYGN